MIFPSIDNNNFILEKGFSNNCARAVKYKTPILSKGNLYIMIKELGTRDEVSV